MNCISKNSVENRYAIVDRFEADVAVLEMPDQSIMRIDRSKVWSDVREGDPVLPDTNGIWHKDETAARQIRKRIRDQMNRLFEG